MILWRIPLLILQPLAHFHCIGIHPHVQWDICYSPPPFLPALCKSALVFVILVPCLTNPSELLCSQSAIVEQPTLWVSMPLPFQGQATWSSVVWCHWKIAGGRQGRKDTSMQLLGPCERISGGRVRPPHCYLALADVESDQPIKVTLASCLNA